MRRRLHSDESSADTRRVKHRFEFGEHSRSGFVELEPSFYPPREQGPDLFKALLEGVPGVERVEWQAAKASQGNVGNHYCEHNLLVYSNIVGPGFASPPIEFELTLNGQPTMTAMFKDPPEGLIGEAWRILLEATDGFQLLPGLVRDYRRRHVTRWESPRRWVTRHVQTACQFSPAPSDASVPDSAQSLPAPAQPVAASSSADGPPEPLEYTTRPFRPVYRNPDEKYRDQLLGAWKLRSQALLCTLQMDDLLKQGGSEPLRDLLEQPRAAQLREVRNCNEAFNVIAQLCSEAGVDVND